MSVSQKGGRLFVPAKTPNIAFKAGAATSIHKIHEYVGPFDTEDSYVRDATEKPKNKDAPGSVSAMAIGWASLACSKIHDSEDLRISTGRWALSASEATRTRIGRKMQGDMEDVIGRDEGTSCVRSASTGCARYEALGGSSTRNGGHCIKDIVGEWQWPNADTGSAR